MPSHFPTLEGGPLLNKIRGLINVEIIQKVIYSKNIDCYAFV